MRMKWYTVYAVCSRTGQLCGHACYEVFTSQKDTCVITVFVNLRWSTLHAHLENDVLKRGESKVSMVIQWLIQNLNLRLTSICGYKDKCLECTLG